MKIKKINNKDFKKINDAYIWIYRENWDDDRKECLHRAVMQIIDYLERGGKIKDYEHYLNRVSFNEMRKLKNETNKLNELNNE